MSGWTSSEACMLIIGPFVSEVFFHVISASMSGEGLSIMSRIKKRRSEPSVKAFLSCSKASRKFAEGS